MADLQARLAAIEQALGIGHKLPSGETSLTSRGEDV
jgi:hypothetical protein